MVASARRKLLGGERQAVFHCWTRCVRRAFLCGRDSRTRKDYSHRRDWIVRREEQLAGLFAIDIEFRAELSSHLHIVLRTLPRVARRWSAHEVARRWLTITKLAKCLSDDLPQPDPQRVEQLAKDKKKIDKLRRRLSSVSWFMGILCENIARRANAEDDCKGRFWESRFRCRECTDTSAVLLCGIYVDLNPYRAGEAESPETARYTSVFQRLQAEGMRKNAADRPDAWLGELTLSPERKSDEALVYASRSGPRVGPGDLAHLAGKLREVAPMDGPATAQWPAEYHSLRLGGRVGPPEREAGRVAGDGGTIRTWFWARRGAPRIAGRRGPADGAEAPERHIRLPQCVHIVAAPALR